MHGSAAPSSSPELRGLYHEGGSCQVINWGDSLIGQSMGAVAPLSFAACRPGSKAKHARFVPGVEILAANSPALR